MYSWSVRSECFLCHDGDLCGELKLFIGVGFGVVEDSEHSLRWCLSLDPVFWWVNHPAARADKGDAHKPRTASRR